jgi:predicted transcriptional regulator
MAIAGPLCSIALAGLFYLIAWLTSDLNEYVSATCAWLALINGMLAIFNMIPGFPLDGGRVLRSIIWLTTGDFMRATRAATIAGYGVSYLFIFGGIIILFTMYWLNGLWLIFIGFFLNSATRATYNQTKLRDTLKGFTAEDVMTRDFPRIPRQLTIKELVNGPLLTSSSQYLLVTDGDSVDGLLTIQQVKEVPREYWDLTTAGQAMAPLEKLKMVQPSDDAISILERIDEDNLEIVAVVREGRLIGMVLRDNLVRFAQRLSDLKK